MGQSDNQQAMERILNLSTSDLSVVVGSNDGLNGKKYTVKSFTTHPKYSYGYFDYDFACVQISGKFKWSSKTKPIKIGTKEPKANAKFTVAGYGDTVSFHCISYYISNIRQLDD
ncbi:hypothetical protein J6590_069307 [Homalodisca vitripennis]|nr:hypothetical protein J6590_069307 [Homalodisca vitripennis]